MIRTRSLVAGDSRKQFDVFYRSVLLGDSEEHPKPVKFKLTKHQLFPEKGTVWDYYYDKKNNGCWVGWQETLEKAQPVAATSKVTLIISHDCGLIFDTAFL